MEKVSVVEGKVPLTILAVSICLTLITGYALIMVTMDITKMLVKSKSLQIRRTKSLLRLKKICRDLVPLLESVSCLHGQGEISFILSPTPGDLS